MKKERLKKTAIYLLLVTGGFITVFPFFWMISTSLKTINEVHQMPPILFPVSLVWENYPRVMEIIPFTRYFINSVFVMVITTVSTVLTSILSAFAFSRLKFWGRDLIFSVFLATLMVPGEVLLIPNFVTISQLGWVNTYQGLIVPWLIGVFAVFLMRQFFLGIPEELYYAAKIDGCKDFKYLWYIMVPLAKPAIVSIALIKAIFNWNGFLWPLVVTNSPDMRTIPVGLAVFTSEAGTQYHLLMAATTMAIVPMIALYIILQKHIIEGISRTGTGIKG